MTTQVQPKWGIVALGIVMLIITTLIGNKGSIYAAVWLMVSYYGYKGNLLSIKNLMKWLIFLNAIVLVFVLLIVDDRTVGYMSSSKEFLAFGVLIMLVPKIILYFYVDGKIGDEKYPIISNKTQNEPSQITASKATSKMQKMPSMEDAYSSIKTQASKNSMNVSLPTINEDKLWEVAIVEFDSENRKKGMWAKCFAEADGDENKAKANYLKLRVAELKAESTNKVVKSENNQIPQIVQNNPNESKPTTISCPMCHTTNLRARDKCASCGYDLRALKRMF